MLVAWCTSGGEDLDLHARVAAALQAWADAAPCAAWTAEDLGDCEAAEGATFSVVGGDPDGVMESDVAYMTYGGLDEVLVVLNDIVFSSDAEVADGACFDALNLDLALRHLLGDHLGLGHTCEAGEACTGDERAAVMYWANGVCEAAQPNAADVALMRAAYGPVALSVGAMAPALGAVPLEVCVAVEAPAGGETGAATFTWDFGDGATAEGPEACHTYEAEGAYTIDVAVDYAAECGAFAESATYGTATACEAPHAADTLFTAGSRGLTVRTANQLENPSACVDTLAWAVTDDAGGVVATSEEWEPTFELAAAGTYTVSLAVTGVGGTAEESLEIRVTEEEGTEGCGGCAAPAGRAGAGRAGAAWLLAGLAGVWGRRRGPPGR